MDLAAHVLSAGWASGVNAYLTVGLLALLGRSGAVEVPEALTSDLVLYGSLAMFAVEFVADKIPFIDSAWDSIHTVVRPAIGGAVGVAFAGDANVSGLDEVLAGGGSAATALASHAVKAGLRLGINSSPEPFSNTLASLTEDGLVAAITVFSLRNPELAAAAAAVLLVTGAAVVVLIWTRIRGAMRRAGERPPFRPLR